MKSRGFTLIELLAVIVILAIIALIATPVVVDIIGSAAESAKLRGAELYFDQVNKELVTISMKNAGLILNGECTINSNGNLECENYSEEIVLNLTGEVPNCGTIIIENNTLKTAEVYMPSGYEIVMGEDGKANITKSQNPCTVIVDNDNSGSGVMTLREKILANNTVKNDTEVDFSKISNYGIDYSDMYVEDMSEGYNTKVTNSTYYFGKSYTFDTNTGRYTLTETVKKSPGSVDISTYPYFCATSKATDNCDVLYQVSNVETIASGNISVYKITGIKHYGVPGDYIENGKGLYSHSGSDNQTTYYFRGNVLNNYVSFAGIVFRIIRINEDGSIRMILNHGTVTSKFNNVASGSHNNALLGYMYGVTTAVGNDDAEKRASVQENTNSSTIKTQLESWYRSNINAYDQYIADPGFCGDRSVFEDFDGKYSKFDSSNSIWSSSGVSVTDTGKGYDQNITFYGGFYRVNNADPSFVCIHQNDLYTVSNTAGNRALTNKVGLITADEVIFAGGALDVVNSSYYLYDENHAWWTMTPLADIDDDKTVEFAGVDGLYYSHVNDSRYMRPVINLSADVIYYSGNGTVDDPYTIVVGGE